MYTNAKYYLKKVFFSIIASTYLHGQKKFCYRSEKSLLHIRHESGQKSLPLLIIRYYSRILFSW